MSVSAERDEKRPKGCVEPLGIRRLGRERRGRGGSGEGGGSPATGEAGGGISRERGPGNQGELQASWGGGEEAVLHMGQRRRGLYLTIEFSKMEVMMTLGRVSKDSDGD